MKCSKQTKNLISEGLLKIKVAEEGPPLHAWEWDHFDCWLHEFEEYSLVKPNKREPDQLNDSEHSLPDDRLLNINVEPLLDDDNEVQEVDKNEPTNTEGNDILRLNFAELNNLVEATFTEMDDPLSASLEWDHSPSQYDLTTEEFPDLNSILHSTPLFDNEPIRNRLDAEVETAEEVSLTSEDDDANVFFHDLAHLDQPVSENQFKRTTGIRKKKQEDIPDHNMPEFHMPLYPLQVKEVQTGQVQNLNKILHPLTPIVPEAVNLGDDAQVQNVGEALHQIQPEERDQHQRRGQRINYATFHKCGEKERKTDGQDGSKGDQGEGKRR